MDAEEKQLRETMDTLVREETWQPMEDAQQTNVLKSSSELFAVIKRSLTRCSKFVSTGAAMLQLCNAFQVSCPPPTCLHTAAALQSVNYVACVVLRTSWRPTPPQKDETSIELLDADSLYIAAAFMQLALQFASLVFHDGICWGVAEQQHPLQAFVSHELWIHMKRLWANKHLHCKPH